MRHLPNPEHPPYVSDRLSAISNLPAQFLIGACVMAVIMIALSFADFMPTDEETARIVDARTIGTVGLTAQN
ncbi:hypothetical protein [Paramesorhizobium deserti]|uniref:hypothetical protein n=1 Tax=Paramesorhizobium deserti TaxID=1494590 RepID=UPI0012903F0A|nr:hypothetical protein [Paramesorhizobium deserti]